MSEYAVICPSCQQLINRDAKRCPNCGWNNTRLSRLAYGFSFTNTTKWLIGINIFFFAAAIILSYLFTERSLLDRFMVFSPSGTILQLMGWADPYSALSGSYWQLISSIFLHGGFFHIIFNMLWLYQLYPQNESLLGTHQTFFVYIFSGIGGSLAATLLGSAPVVGASGAIFGLMASLVAIGRHSNNFMLRFFSKQYLSLMVILLVIGFIMPRVSNLSHLGGAATGYLLGWLFTKKKFNKSVQVYLALISALLTLVSFFFMFRRVITTLLFF